MSDDAVIGPGFLQDHEDAVADTQRDPRIQGDERRLAPGVALSVLWWEDEEATAPEIGV